MGDPKKLKRKYKTPNHPWQKARIEEEKILARDFGLKNKTEIWLMNSILKDFQERAKKLVANKGKQAQIEKEALVRKLISLGLLKPNAEIHDVLSVNIKDLMERRLQTIIVKKTFARTHKQARQFITHGHIFVGGKKINSPSYLITEEEKMLIEFRQSSPLNNSEHPERVVPQRKKKDDKTD